MDNWELWSFFIFSTLTMITICLLLYIFAFVRVYLGSRIKFVLNVLGLMIVSSIGSEFAILSDYALSKCP